MARCGRLLSADGTTETRAAKITESGRKATPVDLRPDDPPSKTFYAYVLLLKGEPAEGLAILQQLLNRNEEDPEVPAVLGDYYFRSQDWPLAEQYYELALRRGASIRFCLSHPWMTIR